MRDLIPTTPSWSFKSAWPVKKEFPKNDRPKTLKAVPARTCNKENSTICRFSTKKPIAKPAAQNRNVVANKRATILHNLQDEGEEDPDIKGGGKFPDYRWRKFRAAMSRLDGTVSEAKGMRDVRAAVKKAEGVEWDRMVFEEDRRRRRRKGGRKVLGDSRRRDV
ncbi:hypothetical protein MMC14_010484 [Varicellaria rhodocarpa]|nr:hypothetical protein [Varicellaria rhodocarpa]